LTDFGQRAILGVAEGYASNHRTTTSKNLRLFIKFANAKVYVCLNQALGSAKAIRKVPKK